MTSRPHDDQAQKTHDQLMTQSHRSSSVLLTPRQTQIDVPLSASVGVIV